MTFNKIIFFLAIIIGLVVPFQSTSSALSNDEDLMVQIRDCSLKKRDSERLKCFDLLAQTIPNTENREGHAPTVLPESLGGGKFDNTSKNIEENRGTVTSCKKSNDGRWFFYFENGQIWKQSNYDHRPRRYKDCNFPVIITSDGFGYKMYIESLSRKVRVKRFK